MLASASDCSNCSSTASSSESLSCWIKVSRCPLTCESKTTIAVKELLLALSGNGLTSQLRLVLLATFEPSSVKRTTGRPFKALAR